MAKEKKVIPETVKNYKKWRNTHYGFIGGEYLVALLPESIMTIIRWDEWVKATGNAWSLGLGFTSVVISVLMTILIVSDKQNAFKEKVSKFFRTALILALWAISLLFLSKIMTEFGYMLLCVAGGLLGSGTAEMIDKKKIQPKFKEYTELYNTYGFNTKANKKEKEKEAHIKLAEEESTQMQKDNGTQI